LSYAIYALAIIFAVLFFRTQIFYEYVVDNGVLTFERGTGRRSKPIAIVELGRIIEFKRYNQLKSAYRAKELTPQYINATLSKADEVMGVSFEINGSYYIVAFNPSDALRARIEAGMSAERAE
jgi:hypothetical protein